MKTAFEYFTTSEERNLHNQMAQMRGNLRLGLQRLWGDGARTVTLEDLAGTSDPRLAKRIAKLKEGLQSGKPLPVSEYSLGLRALEEIKETLGETMMEATPEQLVALRGLEGEVKQLMEQVLSQGVDPATKEVVEPQKFMAAYAGAVREQLMGMEEKDLHDVLGDTPAWKLAVTGVVDPDELRNQVLNSEEARPIQTSPMPEGGA